MAARNNRAGASPALSAAAVALGLMLLVLLGAAAPAGAQTPGAPSSPEARILRLLQAGRGATYAGIQTIQMYMGPRRLDGSARVSHQGGWLRTEILVPRWLKGMVILERGSMRFVRRTPESPWHPSPGLAPLSPRRLLRNYSIQVEGTATIAQRPTTIAAIRTRATGGLARKLWVDSETGVVLRLESYNWQGKLVYVTQFSDIDYTAQVNPAELRPQLPPDWREKLPRPPAGESAPTVGYLPPGYRRMGRPDWVPGPPGMAGAFHLRFADGLNTISVFVRKAPPGVGRERPLPPSGDQPLSSVVHHMKGGYHIMVIGDVEPSELRRIAESLTFPAAP